MHWIIQHYQWVVSLLKTALGWKQSPRRTAPTSTLTAQGTKVTNSPVASGSNISQNINSPTLNLSLPAPISGTPARERYEEWRETIDEVHEAIEQMGYAFVPIVATKAGDERCDYQSGIRRGNRVLHNRILITESLERSGLIKDWNELVQYAHAGRGPRDRWEQGSPTMGGFDTKARTFQEKLMQVAREDVLASTAAPYLSAKTLGHEVPRCEFWLEFDENDLFDNRSLRIQNTGNEAVFDVVVKIPPDGSGFKSDVINRLDNDKSWVPCTSNGNPEYLRSLRAVLAETVLHHSGEGDLQAISVLISCRTRMKQNCECRLEIRLPLRGGIQFAIPASHSGQEVPKQRAAMQQGVEVEVAEISPSEQQDGGADADRKFARLAIDEARKSVPENDGRPHPWVGAVVVKDGKVLGTAHRGEVPGNHAEFVALERNLPDVAVAGATVYTTLEPCTTRNPPKIPCVDRLIERRVARVVIGILDPDDRIRGKGQRKLSNAGIETALFPHDLAMEVEELNREFVRDRESRENERNGEQQAPPEFYNFNGSPGPISLSGIQRSVQGPWMDVWGLVTVVNPTQSHMKIGLHRLVMDGKECPVQRFFFRLKSDPREQFERISLMGNTKEHYEHVMFPENDYPTPPSRAGELWVSSNGQQPFPVKVRCP